MERFPSRCYHESDLQEAHGLRQEALRTLPVVDLGPAWDPRGRRVGDERGQRTELRFVLFKAARDFNLDFFNGCLVQGYTEGRLVV